MPLELGADGRRAIADAGGFGAQLRIADHLFHVAQPVGPVAEALAGDWAFVASGSRLAVEDARQIGLRVSTAACAALGSAGAAPEAWRRLTVGLLTTWLLTTWLLTTWLLTAWLLTAWLLTAWLLTAWLLTTWLLATWLLRIRLFPAWLLTALLAWLLPSVLRLTVLGLSILPLSA